MNAEMNKSRRDALSVKYDLSLVQKIQERLMKFGLHPGPATGIFDTITEDAVRSYQKSYDLTANGEISEALLLHMAANYIDYQATFNN